MAFFDDWDWGEILKPAVSALPQAIASGFGAYQVANANQRAADIAAQTRGQNTQALQESAQRAAGMLAPMAGQQQTGTAYLRQVMARSPYELSPQQQIQVQDARRLSTEMAPSSLRGSGRFVTAASNDVANRTRGGLIAQNQQRSDAAAQSLGNQGAAATTGMANITAGVGPAVASQNTWAAENMGNAAIGTGASNAQTLGNIASFFANAQKDQERESRYKDLRSSLGSGGANNIYVLGS